VTASWLVVEPRVLEQKASLIYITQAVQRPCFFVPESFKPKISTKAQVFWGNLPTQDHDKIAYNPFMSKLKGVLPCRLSILGKQLFQPIIQEIP